MTPYRLRCEYQIDPLGIDVAQPRLDWLLKSHQAGATQSAYQVVVDGLWDSGKVDSPRQTYIIYGGPALKSGQRATWKVRVWDEAGKESAWSEPASFEAGLLDRSDWKGKWIGSSIIGGKYTTAPSPYLRKKISLDKKIESARLYATALGLYEFHINGKRVSDDVFTPGWTDYKHRVQYQTYDVTALLTAGENAIGAILGDGWYCGHVEWRGRQRWGDRPKFLAQIVVRFSDGSSTVIVTDESWKTSSGPILESDMLMGESYDARLEMPGWDTAGFDDSEWSKVKIFEVDPKIAITASAGPRVHRTQELRPIAPPDVKRHWPDYKYIYDLGQNMVGRIRLKVKAPRGTTVTIRHAEMLNPDGTLYVENLRKAKQTDNYTTGSDETEIYEPRFTFHGFRYVEILGLPETARPGDDLITGIVLHSDTPPTGSFECSDSLVNQLQKNITWGQRGNFLEVPTDCPQRDERLGWTGDAQVFIRTAAFNMDVASFFTKWARDCSDAQGPAGQIPPVVPTPDIWPTYTQSGDGGPAWADAAVICPWTVYLCYGDKRILEESYDTCRRFIDFLEKTSPGYIRAPQGADWQGFGDWLSINAETPKDLIGTAFFARSADLMSRIARVLGKNEDAERYSKLFKAVRQAFSDKYISAGGVLHCQTQTAYVLALHFDLQPAHLRGAAVDALVRDIEERNWRLSTGFVGSSYLPHVLSENGALDVAYKLLNQTQWPSWLYAVTKGATTIWERWDGWTHDKGFQDAGMNSFNHYAYGAIGSWLYQVVAGIEIDEARPGYEHIILRPQPGGGLTRASAAIESIRGKISSAWYYEGESFKWEIEIPSNTTATAHVPGGKTVELKSGRHQLSA